MKRKISVRASSPSSLRVAFVCGVSLILFAMIDLPACSRGGMATVTDRGVNSTSEVAPRPAPPRRRWQFACIQDGTILSFNSESAPDHLAAPLMIYDESLKNPIDPNLPGEEMENFAKIVPLNATETEFTFYADGRPLRRPQSEFELLSRATLNNRTKHFAINVDLQNRVGVAREIEGAAPAATLQMAGQDPGVIALQGEPIEIKHQERIERGTSPSGWVLNQGELIIESPSGTQRIPYPNEVFERFARNPHVVKKALFQGLWGGTNEIYVSLTGERGQIIFRLNLASTARGTWSRLTDDHCDSEIVGIEQSPFNEL